ncbi:MAG: YlxM family DNA-binding protein [Lachnospiraceae bacterium]|nr:YlxM family DNA-binding protein [Lachnospiraceae bacterium]MCR5477451.1 YlxM family DNA-binding protein [Lachnospiraceae bacterium]
MNKILERALLYDFYGQLLTQRQRNIFESSVFDDLSLGEIAEQEGVSRQAIHDQLRRAEKALEEYEEKLRLVERFEKMKQSLQRIDELAGALEARIPETGNEQMSSLLEEIRQLSAELVGNS